MQLTLRVTGFLASLLFTLAAYFLILYPSSLGSKTATFLIFVFAGMQAIAQLICFINLWREKGPLWNLYVFLSTVSILFIVIFFSIWIIGHLNYNMTP